MRKIRYVVAMSVDGYIAGPNGEADWIGIDPEVDFAALWAQFDTLVMGRQTLLIGMTRFSSKWILSHSTWYKFLRSRHH
jgi:dihydrofolate reductase